MKIPTNRHRWRGFSLVELMVAILLSMFLIGAMTLMYLSAQRSYSDQDGLVNLQETQRLAVSMLGAVLSHAGYCAPDQADSAANVLPTQAASIPEIAGWTYASGEFIHGIDHVSGRDAGSDAISVRYQSSGSDGIMDCAGRSYNAASSALLVNTFWISAQGELLCAVGTDPGVPLAAGIEKMTVTYGVDVDRDGSVDTYLSAAGVDGAHLWPRVYSVRIALWLQDAGPGGSTPSSLSTPALQPIVHTVVLENQP